MVVKINNVEDSNNLKYRKVKIRKSRWIIWLFIEDANLFTKELSDKLKSYLKKKKKLKY
jgi:hypothetical protein